MTKLHVSANIGHHQVFHPKDLYGVRVFIYKYLYLYGVRMFVYKYSYTIQIFRMKTLMMANVGRNT